MNIVRIKAQLTTISFLTISPVQESQHQLCMGSQYKEKKMWSKSRVKPVYHLEVCNESSSLSLLFH